MAPTIHQPGGTAPGASQVRLSPVPSRSQAVRVDEQEARSVSFARNDGHDHEPEAQQAPPLRDGHEGHALVAVGPGVPGSLLLAGRAGLVSANPLPVQGAKIHRPLLRDDVLSRERLNGWLDRATTGRLALIVAEAGFGKTTLLADWARHTQRLTAWYRLESDDRDWLTFIRHVVGSGRELDPEFAPGTFGLLLQLGPGGPTQGELIASLARELAEFGASTRDGFTLIFDDYHVIDDSEETRPIVRAIIDRTGPGFSVILATRSTPSLAVGRLKARGALARLDGDALCFDEPEAERLFRDAYHQPLDPDVVTDLITRTEGWAALLSLVRTNLDESKGTDPRQLVHQLAGVRGDLYDFVAEEVVSTLPADLRDFLTRASILDEVAPQTASLVDKRPRAEISELIRDSEERGLIARPDSFSSHRFHPLVQTFLAARLRAEIGESGVQEAHRSVARALERTDWRAAATHYRAAGDVDAAARVVDASVEAVLMSGRFNDVRGLLDGSAGSPSRPAALLLRSRVELVRGSLEAAVDLAKAAILAGPPEALMGLALLNVAAILGVAGFPDGAAESASMALGHELTQTQRYVAQATVSLWEAAHRGDLVVIANGLRELAIHQEAAGHTRYASISRLNLATVLLWVGDPREAIAIATEAEDGLRASGSSDVEIGAATCARAVAIAHLGRIDEARRAFDGISSTSSVVARTEARLEMARMHGDFGDADEALASLDQVGPNSQELGFAGMWALVSGQLALRRGDVGVADHMVERLADTPCHDVAGELRGLVLSARVALAAGRGEALSLAIRLRDLASQQHSRPGAQIADILAALASGSTVGPEVAHLMPDDSAVLSMLAEELAANIDRMSSEARNWVARECHAGPTRWRSALRLSLGASNEATAAAVLLAEIGSTNDLQFLRSLALENKSYRRHAASLARLIAPRVFIRDLGAVEIWIGGNAHERPLRRKVLSLACFLLTRPNLAATRDEALEALWPDLGPDTATNSLHQTIYFLRRVFEPDYREGLSAGYVLFDGDVVSLNASFIDSASARCWQLIAMARRSGADVADELLASYSGRFALDFAYEEWSADYRETLHAAVLSVVEAAIQTAAASSANERVIELAQALLALDPGADAVELTLIRAYKQGGRPRAAAEQYAHYASLLREQLAIEALPLDDL